MQILGGNTIVHQSLYPYQFRYNLLYSFQVNLVVIPFIPIKIKEAVEQVASRLIQQPCSYTIFFSITSIRISNTSIFCAIGSATAHA